MYATWGYVMAAVSKRPPIARRWTWARAFPQALVVCVAVLMLHGSKLAIAEAPTGPADATRCNAPKDYTRLGAPLGDARMGLRKASLVRIVALGSSSTQGTGASSPQKCYPAQLELALNKQFNPDKRFKVINLGVGGETAADMLARVDGHVLALKPHLVIWQTGVNDAIRGVPMDDFRMSMVHGIAAIKAAGADVILLDMQYYPKAAKVAGYKDYLATMWEVAREHNVPLLRRHAFMKHLVDSQQYTPAQLLAPDQFHLNDLSYGCLGNLLADAIGDGLGLAQAKASRQAGLPGAR